jgi:cyclopropane-fatty-acyl-phospholipid synthase
LEPDRRVSSAIPVDQQQVTTRSAPLTARAADGTAAAAARRAFASLGNRRLMRLPVTVRFWDGSSLAGRLDAPVVAVDSPRALSYLLQEPGELGLARAWIDGSLTAPGDLEDVLATRGAFADVSLSLADRIRLALAAVRVAGPGVLRPAPIPEIEASVGGNRHSLARDRNAVRHHYDVSNDFYRLVLGPSMVYSCAYFATEDDSLEQAQERKLDLICRKLRLSGGERLLDIGCGWGSLVIHAAAYYGVRAAGVTLSGPQASLARERVALAGLGARVEIRVADYREVADGPFDKIASVGMYEHVGRDQLTHYVGTVAELLRPGGLFLNHGIARLHSLPPTAHTFISRYVFPDGELHPVSDLASSIQAEGLEIRDVESLRDHYPLTLRRWVANLRGRRPEAVEMVGPQRERAWQLYMLASAQAFEAAEITVYQVLATRPDGPHDLPLTRSAAGTPTAHKNERTNVDVDL